jgi:hypothetical protein
MLRFSNRRTLFLVTLLAFGSITGLSAPAGLLAQNIIRGSAQNLSRSQPAVDDDVILLALDQTPPEPELRTKSDAQGAFTFQVQYPGKPYLVRVVHQGVTYDQQASAGDNLSISVFDTAPKVPAISGSIEILRVGTRVADNQKLLHVSDMYELRNESSPPMTQAGARTFDVYLPANAKIDSVLAAGPGPERGPSQNATRGKIGLMISASPVAGEPGHYTVNFPLRPGATKFAFNYDVPYPGHATFQTKHQYGFQQFAVMLPRNMPFSSPSAAFQKLPTAQNDYQVQAAMQVKAGQGPAFEVSGDGPVPSLQANNQAPPQSQVPFNSTVADSARVLPRLPSHLASKLGKTSFLWPWLILPGCALLACALLVLGLRNRRLGWWSGRSAALGVPAKTSASFLESLKEELFQLEADRARGSISADEYSSARQALEETVKRAVTRPPAESGPSFSNPTASRTSGAVLSATKTAP